MVKYLKISHFIVALSNSVLIFLRNVEWDCIYFSSLVKDSFQIFGPLTKIEYFVLVSEQFLYVRSASENWVGYLWVDCSKTVLNILKPVPKVSMLI